MPIGRTAIRITEEVSMLTSGSIGLGVLDGGGGGGGDEEGCNVL